MLPWTGRSRPILATRPDVLASSSGLDHGAGNSPRAERGLNHCKAMTAAGHPLFQLAAWRFSDSASHYPRASGGEPLEHNNGNMPQRLLAPQYHAGPPSDEAEALLEESSKVQAAWVVGVSLCTADFVPVPTEDVSVYPPTLRGLQRCGWMVIRALADLPKTGTRSAALPFGGRPDPQGCQAAQTTLQMGCESAFTLRLKTRPLTVLFLSPDTKDRRSTLENGCSRAVSQPGRLGNTRATELEAGRDAVLEIQHQCLSESKHDRRIRQN